VGTLCRKCLDHVLSLGERHLRKAWPSTPGTTTVIVYTRPCSSDPHSGSPARLSTSPARVERRQVLDGLITEYRIAA
jgi:hypothetical protein